MMWENTSNRWGRYLILLFLWVGIVGWLWYENFQQYKQEKERLREQAQVITDTVSSSIRAQSRLAMYKPERLHKTLEEVTSVDMIVAIAVLDQNYNIVAISGDENQLLLPSSTRSNKREIWSNTTLQLWSPVRIGKIPWMTRHHKRLREQNVRMRNLLKESKHKRSRTSSKKKNKKKSATEKEKNPKTKSSDPTYKKKHSKRSRPKYPPNSKFFLTVAVSQSSIQQNTALGENLRAVIAIMSLILLIALGYFWEDSLKSLHLQASLELEQRKSQHLYEMNIAANGLAHETKNPLNSLRLMTQTFANEYPNLQDKFDVITDEVDRISSRINEWLAFSKQTAPQIEVVPLTEIFAELKTLMTFDLEEKEIDFSYSLENIKIQADREMFRQLLFNLILNAIQAVHPKSELFISIINQKNNISIQVEDNGPGVEEKDQPNLFSPYFTTREEGSGLGLAICKQIALAHKWHIYYEDSPKGGARFVIANIQNFVQ